MVELYSNFSLSTVLGSAISGSPLSNAQLVSWFTAQQRLADSNFRGNLRMQLASILPVLEKKPTTDLYRKYAVVYRRKMVEAIMTDVKRVAPALWQKAEQIRLDILPGSPLYISELKAWFTSLQASADKSSTLKGDIRKGISNLIGTYTRLKMTDAKANYMLKFRRGSVEAIMADVKTYTPAIWQKAETLRIQREKAAAEVARIEAEKKALAEKQAQLEALKRQQEEMARQKAAQEAAAKEAAAQATAVKAAVHIVEPEVLAQEEEVLTASTGSMSFQPSKPMVLALAALLAAIIIYTFFIKS